MPSFSVTATKLILFLLALVTNVLLAISVNPVFPPVVYLYVRSNLFLLVQEYTFLLVVNVYFLVDTIFLAFLK